MNRTSPTPRDRVEQALRRELPEQVPFTTYESKLPQCAAERSLRNRGLCIVHRRNVFQSHFPNVTIRQETFAEGGRRLTRTHYGTPVGALSTLEENAGFTTWFHERMFKTPDDYRALRFLIRDEVDTPDYAAYARTEADFGGDAICRAGFGLEPLQALISGQYLGMTDFCLEWMDRRDEVLKLYEALVENRRRRYALVAESPASHANYGGNVVPAIVGPELFEDLLPAPLPGGRRGPDHGITEDIPPARWRGSSAPSRTAWSAMCACTRSAMPPVWKGGAVSEAGEACCRLWLGGGKKQMKRVMGWAGRAGAGVWMRGVAPASGAC